VATCLAYHPRADRHLLACGFARGHLRVFDVASTRTLVEYQVCARAVFVLVGLVCARAVFEGGL
jgi:hypothetical protein